MKHIYIARASLLLMGLFIFLFCVSLIKPSIFTWIFGAGLVASLIVYAVCGAVDILLQVVEKMEDKQ